jgi:peptide/nickel transport system substrate-binding protein
MRVGRSRRGRWLVAGLLVVAAACGGDDDDSATATVASSGASASTAAAGDTATTAADTTSAASAPAATESAPTEPSATTAADVATDPEGTLKMATFVVYPWDPAKSSSGYSITSLALVFDRLVHTSPDGDLVPGLATEWDYSADGMTLTFHLRDGVQFQDGTPFDAAAVKANIDRSMTLEGSSAKPDLARIAEVVVVDPQTVELHLTSADATLPAVLSGPAGAMMSPASMADPQVDAHPVGAGMFKLVDYQPGSSYAVERWDGYWDPDAVKVKRIEVVALPDSAARTNALRAGEVDIAPVEPADVESVESTDDVAVRRAKTLRYVYLAMNLAMPPLDNLKVRQAIMYAMDRQSLVDGVFFGLGTPTEQPWPEGYFPHVDGLDDTYPYDPDKARALLAEAGFPDGFSADIIVVPSPTVYTQLGEAAQAQLAEVGINLTVQLTEPADLGQSMYIDKTAAFALLYTNGSIDPANTVGSRFAANGFFNAGKYSTPKLEELYQQAIATTDEAERTTVLQGVSTEVVEQVLDMPLFFALEPMGVNDRVVGYEDYFTGKPEFRGVAVASS